MTLLAGIEKETFLQGVLKNEHNVLFRLFLLLMCNQLKIISKLWIILSKKNTCTNNINTKNKKRIYIT